MHSLKQQKTFSTLNLISVFIAVGINYYSQIYKINGNTVGSLSNEYKNLFTPAGYAFSIWGLIFISLFIFAGYQVYQTFIRKNTMDFISQSGYWFMIANLGNALWVIVWLNELHASFSFYNAGNTVFFN